MKKKILMLLLLLMVFLSTFKPKSVEASSPSAIAGIVDTNGSYLNVRKNTSTSSSIISQIKDDSYLTILNTLGDWYYVEYKDSQFGYVHKNYIDIISTKTRMVNTNGYNLNVRTGPGTNYKIIEKIQDKDYLVVISSSTYWSKVLFEGNKIGYVYNNYLSSTINYKYPAINLNVTSYKQFDSRWAYETIGKSGQTFKKAGCLITAMAMTESYRTNNVITPLAFENKSSFTSSGALYWPSNYNFITSSNGYLSKIYNLLSQGKPVIIGNKNSSGGQHWIVIYGYNGSNTLDAKNFLIHDPGYNKNNLSQHLNSYPSFYKIAYYD